MSLAFVFPGQGSQAIGMLGDLATHHSLVKSTYDEASAALGFDLWDIVQNGPEAKLNSTEITQPAMLAAGVACWRIWLDRHGKMPVVMAGHSLGEYTALVCADSLLFADAIKLVTARGKYMQQAVPNGIGAMAAILGLDDAIVTEVCALAAQSQVVQAVNFNSPGQVVIAGHKDAVERATILAKEKGAKRAVLLPVSVPSHCDLMRPAAQQLMRDMAEMAIQKPKITVLNNVDVAQPTDPALIRDALMRQLYQPVRWVEIIQQMAKQGVVNLVECGPGKVLTGLNKRIEKSLATFAIHDSESLSSTLQSINS